VANKNQPKQPLPVASAAPPGFDVDQAGQCPLCRRERKRAFRKLYGVWICRKCHTSFLSRRQSAFLIDQMIWWIAGFAVSVALGVFAFMATGGFSGPAPPVSNAAGIVALVLPWLVWGSFCLKDGYRGQSPGRWLSGLQVVDTHTREPIGLKQSFKRNILFTVPYVNLIFLLIGLVQMRRGPRIGDGWAGTTVIWKKYRHRYVFDPRGILCLECGYNLTGNVSGRCPECGTTVADTQDAASG